jgi:hypothetical protein
MNYFPNGCNLCGNPVEYNQEIHIYKCTVCEAYVSAHREDTDYSKEHEPTGYLADEQTRSLKKQLKPLFNFLWKGRQLFQTEKGLRFKAPINVLYRPFIRKVLLLDEPLYGIAQGITDEGLVKLRIIGEDRFGFYKHDELDSVDNRTKAHIWLAEHLGLTINQCRIGYLDKEQLLKAIKLCTEHGELAREQIAYNKGA